MLLILYVRVYLKESLSSSRRDQLVLNTLEKSKKMTLCFPAYPGGISPVQQVDDGVIHADLGLLCELQMVQGAIHHTLQFHV